MEDAFSAEVIQYLPTLPFVFSNCSFNTKEQIYFQFILCTLLRYFLFPVFALQAHSLHAGSSTDMLTKQDHYEKMCVNLYLLVL